MFLTLLACTQATTDSGETAAPAGTALSDATGATLSRALTVGGVDIAPVPEMAFDRHGLTQDASGGPLDPHTVNSVDLYWFSTLDEAGVLAAITAGGISQSQTTGWASAPLGDGRDILAFAEFGTLAGPSTAVDFFTTGEGSWLLVFRGGANIPVWATFLRPTLDSAPDPVDLAAAPTHLTVSASAAAALTVPAGAPTLDWSGLTVDGTGAPWSNDRAERLLLAPITDPAAAAADVFSAWRGAASHYSLDVYGSTAASLTEATEPSGAAFPGLQSGETWAVGLVCDACLLPGPVYLSTLTAP